VTLPRENVEKRIKLHSEKRFYKKRVFRLKRKKRRKRRRRRRRPPDT